MRLAQKGRDQRHQQQDDQPGVEDHQPAGKGDNCQHILDLAHKLAEQRHPPAGLAAGAVQLVLEFGILEIFQIQRGRMFHQPD